MNRCVLSGISYYLPPETLTNEKLAEETKGWTAEKIYQKTGIKQRHCAGSELVSDMAVNAGKLFFEEWSIKPSSIDMLLLCTENPDYFLPSTACIVQDRLGLPHSCGALDFNLGCSGFVYGLALAKGLIHAGEVENILLITADTLTKHIHNKDSSTRTLFGDAAASVFITKGDTGPSLGRFIFGTDGKGFRNLMIPAGGMALPRSPETAIERTDDKGYLRSPNNLFMNGPEIFNFSLKTVPRAAEQILAREQLSQEQIDLFIFHQSNTFMLETLRRAMKIPEQKFYINMENFGNTVSSTIPIALINARDEGKLKEGDLVMLIGFGVGYSWGATILKWADFPLSRK